MKQFGITASESILLMMVLEDKRIPDLPIKMKWITIPIVIDAVDKDVTGRLWQVKTPVMQRLEDGRISTWSSDSLTMERDMSSGEYTFHLDGKDIASLRKFSSAIDNNGIEYCYLNLYYRETDIASIMIKSTTEAHIDSLISSFGYTVTYFDYVTGKPRVAGRFKTEVEKDKYLAIISNEDSGWLPEELQTISVHPNYNYMLPY